MNIKYQNCGWNRNSEKFSTYRRWLFMWSDGHRKWLKRVWAYRVVAIEATTYYSYTGDVNAVLFVTVRAGTAYRKIWRLINKFFFSHNKVHCSEISIVLSNLLYHFFHWIMAHFNFVISQNAKWGHAGFYIDCHRMTVPENILLQKSTV